jgi:hypothetical protein
MRTCIRATSATRETCTVPGRCHRLRISVIDPGIIDEIERSFRASVNGRGRVETRSRIVRSAAVPARSAGAILAHLPRSRPPSLGVICIIF